MNDLPKVQRYIAGVGFVMVTLCPPRAASGAVPFHVDPIDELLQPVAFDQHPRYAALFGEPCEDDCEVSTGSILDPIAAEADHLPEGFGTAEIMGFASEPSRSSSHRESDNTFGNAMFESSVVASLCDADRRRRG